MCEVIRFEEVYTLGAFFQIESQLSILVTNCYVFK
jgi:hypothetical protein